ncbi:hypothetical protein [Prescottella equi]|uniref:hypothetical protein n=1 Tax=Rhodococcus hoagii TaxID=43767 RepID=UPI0007CD4DB6|nr:hypothetical protein [Prescottella equi]
MGWLDTPDLCYTDAVTVLAAATHRPVRVVLYRGRRVVRVDFEFGRFLLARNDDTGTTTDPDACGDWTVTVHDEQDPSAGVLAEATDEWLADAFDRVYDVARAVPGRQLAASAADAATVAAPSVTVPSAAAVALC